MAHKNGTSVFLTASKLKQHESITHKRFYPRRFMYEYNMEDFRLKIAFDTGTFNVLLQ